MPTLYKVPGLMNPRESVWAIKCIGCGKELRLGPGSKAGILRLLGVTGTRCRDCAEAAEWATADGHACTGDGCPGCVAALERAGLRPRPVNPTDRGTRRDGGGS